MTETRTDLARLVSQILLAGFDFTVSGDEVEIRMSCAGLGDPDGALYTTCAVPPDADAEAVVAHVVMNALRVMTSGAADYLRVGGEPWTIPPEADGRVVNIFLPEPEVHVDVHVPEPRKVRRVLERDPVTGVATGMVEEEVT
jgi:hypothetical protein